MFNNIGAKIKTLAVILTWAGIFISLISGIITYSALNETDNVLAAFLLFLIPVVGSLLSWISSFFMYGFGQLIENSAEIRANTEELLCSYNEVRADSHTDEQP